MSTKDANVGQLGVTYKVRANQLYVDIVEAGPDIPFDVMVGFDFENNDVTLPPLDNYTVESLAEPNIGALWSFSIPLDDAFMRATSSLEYVVLTTTAYDLDEVAAASVDTKIFMNRNRNRTGTAVAASIFFALFLIMLARKTTASTKGSADTQNFITTELRVEQTLNNYNVQINDLTRKVAALTAERGKQDLHVIALETDLRNAQTVMRAQWDAAYDALEASKNEELDKLHAMLESSDAQKAAYAAQFDELKLQTDTYMRDAHDARQRLIDASEEKLRDELEKKRQEWLAELAEETRRTQDALEQVKDLARELQILQDRDRSRSNDSGTIAALEVDNALQQAQNEPRAQYRADEDLAVTRALDAMASQLHTRTLEVKALTAERDEQTRKLVALQADLRSTQPPDQDLVPTDAHEEESMVVPGDIDVNIAGPFEGETTRTTKFTIELRDNAGTTIFGRDVTFEFIYDTKHVPSAVIALAGEKGGESSRIFTYEINADASDSVLLIPYIDTVFVHIYVRGEADKLVSYTRRKIPPNIFQPLLDQFSWIKTLRTMDDSYRRENDLLERQTSDSRRQMDELMVAIDSIDSRLHGTEWVLEGKIALLLDELEDAKEKLRDADITYLLNTVGLEDAAVADAYSVKAKWSAAYDALEARKNEELTKLRVSLNVVLASHDIANSAKLDAAKAAYTAEIDELQLQIDTQMRDVRDTRQLIIDAKEEKLRDELEKNGREWLGKLEEETKRTHVALERANDLAKELRVLQARNRAQINESGTMAALEVENTLLKEQNDELKTENAKFEMEKTLEDNTLRRAQDELKTAHVRADELALAYQQKVAELEAHHAEEIGRLAREHAAKIDELNQSHGADEAMYVLQETSAKKELAAVREAHRVQLEELDVKHKDELADAVEAAREEYRANIAQLETTHKDELAQAAAARKNLRAEIAQLEAKHKDELANAADAVDVAQEERYVKLVQLNRAHQAEIDQLEGELRDAIAHGQAETDRAVRAHDARIAALQEAHRVEIARIRAACLDIPRRAQPRPVPVARAAPRYPSEPATTGQIFLPAERWHLNVLRARAVGWRK